MWEEFHAKYIRNTFDETSEFSSRNKRLKGKRQWLARYEVCCARDRGMLCMRARVNAYRKRNGIV